MIHFREAIVAKRSRTSANRGQRTIVRRPIPDSRAVMASRFLIMRPSQVSIPVWSVVLPFLPSAIKCLQFLDDIRQLISGEQDQILVATIPELLDRDVPLPFFREDLGLVGPFDSECHEFVPPPRDWGESYYAAHRAAIVSVVCLAGFGDRAHCCVPTRALADGPFALPRGPIAYIS
jgi:hypothetical protein